MVEQSFSLQKTTNHHPNTNMKKKTQIHLKSPRWLTRYLLLTAAFLTLVLNSNAATVAYWNFEDGTNGVAFTPAGAINGSGGSTDLITGTLMHGWSSTAGPSWTNATYGTGLGANFANAAQDGYVFEGPLINWSPTNWTIECMVNLRTIAGWRTLIGRDGTAGGGADPSAADFYLQNNGIDDSFRVNFKTADGRTWILDGAYTPVANKWYGLAVSSDGVTLSMWLDDASGSGYTQIGSLDMSAYTPEQNAPTNTALTWTFGRGWYGGNQADKIDGMMDNVRFSDVALTSAEFLKFPTNAFVLSGPTPSSQIAPVGGTASFSVVAGGIAPFTYQWRHEGTNIPGANSATYNITSVTLADAGNYVVVVDNIYNSPATSSVAVLTLHTPRPLTWAGTAGAWDTITTDWTNVVSGGGLVNYLETDNVIFNTLGTAQPLVTLDTAHIPSSVTVDGSSYTLTGAAINSAGALTLQNSASLVLSNANSFAGGTTIGSGSNLRLRAAGNSLGELSVAAGGKVHLNGNSQTAAALLGGGLISTTNGSPALTFGSNNANTPWGGSITNEGGTPSFIKVGSGTTTISASNYVAGGASQVNGGVLSIASGGAIVPVGTAEFWIGQGATTGAVEVASGAFLGASNWLVVGRANAAAKGTLTINGGTVRKAGGGNVVIGSLGGDGELIVNSGQLLNNAIIWVGENANADAILRVNGGLVQATQIGLNGTPSSSTVFFNGGTVQAMAASADFMPATSPFLALIQAGGLVFDNNGYDITFNTLISEDTLTPSLGGGLTKMGAGTLNLAGGYYYNGPTIVQGGTLGLNPSSGLLLTAPSLIVSNAAVSLGVGGFTGLNANNVTLGNNAVLNLDYGNLTAGNPYWAGIAASGGLTASGTSITINLSGSGWVVSPTPIPLITYTGAQLASIANFTLNQPPGVTCHLVNNPNSLDVVIDTAINLSWYGDVNNVWDIGGAANWADNGVPGATFAQGSPVRLDDTAVGNLAINLTANVNPATVTVDAAVNNYSITGAGSIGGGTSVVKTNTGTILLNTANTYTGGTVIGQGTLTVNNGAALGATSGTVSLKGGTLQFGANTSTAHPVATTANSSVDVVSGVTATLSGSISGTSALSKTGDGTLVMSGNATHSGTLRAVAGTLNLSGGTKSFNGPSYAGYLNGNGTLNLTGGSNYFAGDFRVGGSPTSGLGITPTGTVTIANSTMSVGSMTIARGNNNQNTCIGTVTVENGGTLNSEGDILLDFAGDANNHGILNINAGGTVNLATATTRWFIMSQWDFGDATLNVNGGQLNLNANTALRFAVNGNNGTNIVNLNSGGITGYSDNKTTVGGTGELDLHRGTGASTNIFNLNGGTLRMLRVMAGNASGTREFNFNGGTLSAVADTTTFFSLFAGDPANVRNGGAIIDSAGFNVTIPHILQHSAKPGDSATDGGLTKLGAGSLTLSATNTYNGNTTISNGTLIISAAYLADTSDVNIATGGKLQMNFAGSDTVNALKFDGVAQANGTYGATGSGAANIDDIHFAGTGVLQVGEAGPTLDVTHSGNTLTFNWTGAYKLVAQTNSLGVGLQTGAVWYDVPGGGTSGVVITIDPAQPTVFFGLTPTP